MAQSVVHFVREMLKIVLSITLVMCTIVISLYLLKNIPSYIHESEEKIYITVEEAEYAIGLRIFLPSYFPEYLKWPPSTIQVSRKPSLTISLVFLSRNHISPSLVIHQSPSLVIHQIVSNIGKSNDVELNFMEPKIPFKETQVSVGGAKGALIVGEGEDGKRWSRLSWKAADRKMVLIANCSVEDLLKIARSIH